MEKIVSLNPQDKSSNITLSNNNLTAYNANTGWGGVRVNSPIDGQKIYLEITANNTNGNVTIIGVTNKANFIGGYTLQYGYSSSGSKVNNEGNFLSYGQSYVEGDVISLLIDMDKNNGTLEFWKNGITQGVAFTNIKDVFGDEIYFCLKLWSGSKATVNFGKIPFKYKIPKGYKAYVPYSNKYLIQDKSNNLYTIDSIPQLNILGNNLTEELFENKGISDPTVIKTTNMSTKTFDGVDKGNLGTGKYFELSLKDDMKTIKSIE